MDISTREGTSKKVRRNYVDFSTIAITSKKARGNNVDFPTMKIISKKVHWNNVDFSTIEITLKKVRGKNVNLLNIEITSKKVRGNDVDISISKITWKKYVQMAWKFVEIWSSTYRCKILVKSTSIRCDVPIGYNLKFSFYLSCKYFVAGTLIVFRSFTFM